MRELGSHVLPHREEDVADIIAHLVRHAAEDILAPQHPAPAAGRRITRRPDFVHQSLDPAEVAIHAHRQRAADGARPFERGLLQDRRALLEMTRLLLAARLQPVERRQLAPAPRVPGIDVEGRLQRAHRLMSEVRIAEQLEDDRMLQAGGRVEQPRHRVVIGRILAQHVCAQLDRAIRKLAVHLRLHVGQVLELQATTRSVQGVTRRRPFAGDRVGNRLLQRRSAGDLVRRVERDAPQQSDRQVAARGHLDDLGHRRAMHPVAVLLEVLALVGERVVVVTQPPMEVSEAPEDRSVFEVARQEVADLDRRRQRFRRVHALVEVRQRHQTVGIGLVAAALPQALQHLGGLGQVTDQLANPRLGEHCELVDLRLLLPVAGRHLPAYRARLVGPARRVVAERLLEREIGRRFLDQLVLPDREELTRAALGILRQP